MEIYTLEQAIFQRDKYVRLQNYEMARIFADLVIELKQK